MDTVQVLFAEDKIEFLNLIEEYLSADRILIGLHTFSRIEEIYSVLNSDKKYDLLIIDLSLSISDLDVFIRKIKILKPELPILIITTDAEETDILRRNGIYADSYLESPKDGFEIIKGIIHAGNFYSIIVKNDIVC